MTFAKYVSSNVLINLYRMAHTMGHKKPLNRMERIETILNMVSDISGIGELLSRHLVTSQISENFNHFSNS